MLLTLCAGRASRFLAIVATQLGPALAGPPTGAASAELDLLEPERAFQLSASRKDAKTVELHYKIADGYYMYRARFKFVVEPIAPAKLGKPKLPHGMSKQDPTFGKVEIYRNSVRILLPLATAGQKTATDAQSVQLKVTSQGCADVGVCYPPLRQQLTFRTGVSEVVLPDVDSGSDFAGRLQSTPPTGPQTLMEALGKTK